MLELSLRYGSGLVFWVFCLVASLSLSCLALAIGVSFFEQVVGVLGRLDRFRFYLGDMKELRRDRDDANARVAEVEHRAAAWRAELERVEAKGQFADAERQEILGQLTRAREALTARAVELRVAEARAESLEASFSADRAQQIEQLEARKRDLARSRAAGVDRSRPTFASGGLAFDTLRDAGPPADRIHDRARRGINEEF